MISWEVVKWEIRRQRRGEREKGRERKRDGERNINRERCRYRRRRDGE